jgi:abhydrolase domain-containing protein 6
MGSGGPRFGRRRRRRRGWRAPLWIAVLLLVAFLLAGWLRPDWFLAAEFQRQRLLAGASERSVSIDGQVWRYLEAGDGPPLVLLHGFTGSKENWLPVFAALAREHRVLAPDLPGWGYFGSEPVAPPYGYSADARRLARFIQTMVPTGRAGLVGHSMGGGIAALSAAQFPGALDRLVLMSASGVAFDNAFARAVQAGDHPFGVADREALHRFMGLVFADPPWVPWPVDRALVQHRQSRIAFEQEVLAAISIGPDAAAPGAMAGEIHIPTLLLWCRDDQVVDLASAAVYAAAIDDTRRVLLEGCGHMPMMERPQETARSLLDFLRRDRDGEG